MHYDKDNDIFEIYEVSFAIDEENEEGYLELPSKFGVCPRCDGKGSHIHDAMFVMTESDFADMSPDEYDNFWSGAYDVPCTECKGMRVVKVPDLSGFSKEEKKIIKERIRKDEDDDYADWRMQMGEMGMY